MSRIPDVSAPEERGAFVPGPLTGYAQRDGMTDMGELARRILPPNTLSVVKRNSESYGTPIETVIPVMIGMASACIGGRRRLFVDIGFETGANLYQMLIGEADSSASALAGRFLAPLRRRQEERETQLKAEMERYRKGMRAFRRNLADGLPRKPVKMSLIAGNAAIEPILSAHGRNPFGLLWAIDKGASWLAQLGRSVRDTWTPAKAMLIRAWRNDCIHIIRPEEGPEDRDIYIPAAFISILASVEPGILSRSFLREDTFQRLMHRFLFICLPPEAPGTGTEISGNPHDDTDMAHLDEIAGALLGLEEKGAEEGKALRIPDEVFELCQKERAKMAEALHLDSPSASEDLIGRMILLNDMIFRFALILHYLHWADSEESRRADPDTHITKEDFERAFDLARIYMIHLDRVLWAANADRGSAERRLSPEELRIARFVLENPGFFADYRTIEEMQERGLTLPDGMDRRLFGCWLKKQGFPQTKLPGCPGKYLLRGLEPWKDCEEIGHWSLSAPELVH